MSLKRRATRFLKAKGVLKTVLSALKKDNIEGSKLWRR